MDKNSEYLEMMDQSVSQGAIVIDPQSRNHTIPRTYGVYKLLKSLTGDAKQKYRFGNHPVRMKELIREHGETELVALFVDRKDAVQYASFRNRLGNDYQGES